MVGDRSMHTEAIEGLRALTCQNLEVGSLEG